MPPKPVFGVTGAGGYLGTRFCAFLESQGYATVRFSSKSGRNTVPFSLREAALTPSLDRVEILVHCAYDFHPADWREIFEINVRGSEELFDAAKRAGVRRILYISSLAAFEDARSLYGRAKYLVEKEALKRGVVVVRPGLIYGSGAGGMFGALDKAVRVWPAVPLVAGNQELYLIHEDDLSQILVRIALEDELPGEPIAAASARSIRFKEVIRAQAKRRGKETMLVPIPWRLVWFLLRMCETVRINPGFRSDSLISLMNQNPRPDFTILKKLGIPVRDFL